MSFPKISVLIPSYNHENYIKEAIESVLNQTFQDFELIIIDDGSTDKTVDKIKEFDDERIQLYVFEKNQGAPNAINNCIKRAKGEYIAYISSDDVWELDKLEKQVNFMEKNPSIDVLFTKVSFIGENSEILDENSSNVELYNFYKDIFDKNNRSREEWLKRFFLKGNCICHPSILIKKEIYDIVGLYDERLANLPDFDMWVRICFNHDIYILDEKLVRFRIRDNDANISSPTPETHKRIKFEQKQILNHYLSIDDVSLFLKIFPDSRKYGKVIKELIPYFLGRIACDLKKDVYYLWGLELIYGSMKSNEINLILKDYGFEFSSFIEMTASEDVFHIDEIKVLRSNMLELRSKLEDANLYIPKLQKYIKEINCEIKFQREKIKDKNEILESQKEEIKKQKILLKNEKKIISEIKVSNSWKITKPLRFLSNSIKKIIYNPFLYIILKRNIKVRKLIVDIKGYKQIKKISLFNENFYKNRYQLKTQMNPLIHYMYYGFKDGKNPSKSFNTKYYLDKYPDVKKSKMNPLIHFALYGRNEGKIPKKGTLPILSDEDKKKLEDIYGVSVIMPTYNRSKVIINAINSVLNQTFKNYELIIVDDGSTDNTEKLIHKKYSEQIETGKIKYIKKANGGVSSARNEGLKNSKKNIIAYLDSDNRWFEHFLETMVQTLHLKNSNTVYSIIDVENTITNRKHFIEVEYNRKNLLNANFIDLNVFIHKKFIYDQLGGFDESLTRLVDWDLILRYTRLNKPSFVNETLAKYYIDENLNNISNIEDFDLNLEKIKMNHLDERIEKGIEKLKIAYILKEFPIHSQMFIMDELRYLIKKGYDVMVFYKEDLDEFAMLNFDIKSVKIKDRDDLANKIAKYKVNLIHTHFSYPSCVLSTYYVAKKTKVKFTISALSTNIFDEKNVEIKNFNEISNSPYCKTIFIQDNLHNDYSNEKILFNNKITILPQTNKHNDLYNGNLDINSNVKNISNIEKSVERMLEVWKNKKIDIFMVTYQKEKYKDISNFKNILNRIFNYTSTQFDLTIVDNNSDEDFKLWVEKYMRKYKNIRFISLNENIFRGPASNIALKNLDNEYFIYISSDAGFVLRHGWESEAIDFMNQNPNVGLAGDLSYSPNFFNGETYKNLHSFKKFRNQDFIKGKNYIPIRHVQGGGYILRKKAYLDGGFNKKLPQEHGDVEYSYYLNSKGWELGKLPRWISLTKKTIPGVFASYDENTNFIHPINNKNLIKIEKNAINHCNICEGEINTNNICESCGSNRSERTIYRILIKTDKLYRSVKCTLILNQNTIYKQLGGMFDIINENYSTKSVFNNKKDYNGITEIIKKIEETEVLVLDNFINENNYIEVIEIFKQKIFRNGLIILKLTADVDFNKKLKEEFTNNNFQVETVQFNSKKFSVKDFLVVNVTNKCF